jgi:sialate O-acetylesterase
MAANHKPQSMTIQGKANTLTLENILVGDLWLLGGQSNMEFEITKVDEGDLEVVSANFPAIRLITIPQLNGPDAKSDFPRHYQWNDFFSQHYRQGYWDVCSPETVRDMSGIGYVFARRLHMAARVPIGIVDTSRGGTCLETWTPLEVIKATPTEEAKAMLAEWDQKVAQFDSQQDLDKRVKEFNDWAARMKAEGKPVPQDRVAPTDLRPGPALDMNRPGNCYASMIMPMAGLAVKGAIWHQGFNNALQPNGHALYSQLFTKMISAWRSAFNDPEMPFGIISLCTAGEPQTLDNFLEKMLDEGIYIREAHFKTFWELHKAGDKNIGYASSFDLRRSWYHPQIKIPAGERIARWALATQYGFKQLRWMPPAITEVVAQENCLHLHIDRLTAPYHDGPIQGFAIAGQDGHFQPATATYLEKGKDDRGRGQEDKKVIVLSSPLVPKPVHFRHAWGRNPMANLKSSDHTNLPLPTLRSDTWTLADMYELHTGEKPTVAKILSRAEQNKLEKALRAADTKRRAAEAEAFLKANPKP